MENLMENQKKNSFSTFASALACVVFIILNLLFLELYSALVPSSTINGNIVIPSSTSSGGNTYTVKNIDDEAFYASSKINNIVISSGIEKIGTNAFAGTGISTIYIPSTVKTILTENYNSSPFYACKKTLVIYLEANEVPEGFGEYWNYRTYNQPFEVKMGVSYSDYLLENELTENDLLSTDDSQVGFVYNSDGTATVIRGKEGFSKLNKSVYYIASFLIEFMFAVAAYIVSMCVKTNIWKASGMNKKINGKIVLLGAIISIVCLIFFSGITQAFLNLLYLLGYSSRDVSIDIPNFGVYLVYVLTACIAPAVCEELLFRGVVESGMKAWGERVAILASAVIFCLMHGSPDQTVHQFVIGFILGYIFIKTGNLWLGVIIHFFNNFIAITETFIVQMLLTNSKVSELVDEAAQTTEETVSQSLSLLSLIISIAFSVFMAIIGYKIVKYLADKMIDESNKLNGVTKAENTQNAQDVQTTTISINGEPTETEMLISGDGASEVSQSIEEEARQEFEEDELFAEIQQKHEQKEEKQNVPLSVIVMFAGSGAYLVIQWIIALISGF